LVGTPLLQKEGKVLNYTYLTFSSFGRRSTPDGTVRGEVVSFETPPMNSGNLTLVTPNSSSLQTFIVISISFYGKLFFIAFPS
jgi:hypothetical protein